MKKLLLGSMAIAALAMVGCSNENDLLFDENTQEVFSGEIITSNSRTSLGENGKTLWSDGDAINLFKKTGYYQKYVVKQGGSVTTDFVYGGVSKTGATLEPHHYAVYPYAEGNSIDAETKVISVNLSGLAEQTYVEGSFDPADAVMVAKSENTNLPFTNTLSMARVKISKGGSVVDATVQSIEFTSTDEALTGDATIDMNMDKPAAVITGSGKGITLNTNNAELSSEATPFYVLIPANTYEAKSLTLTVKATVNGEPQVITKDYDALNFQRSLIETFNIEITEDGNWSGSTEGEEILTHIVVSTPEELAALLTSSKDEISVKLANDIDLPISSLGTMTGGSGEYKLGGENTQNIIIDLNDKNLNITTTYWSNLGAKNDNALFTIKNGTMTSSQPTGTWNSYDLCFSNCNYVIEDVEFEKAIAFGNANKSVSLKNVTINETHDYYAMWIEAVGQNVTIDGLTINSDGRGIKIDEEYVDAPAKVTLNISNATFNTAKKAAIVVKSAAGAEINASNLNIDAVAEDNYHAVWVDEDAAAYADKVVVNGALKAVEGAFSIVTTTADFDAALSDANVNVILLSETINYTNTVAVSIEKDLVINANNEKITAGGASSLTPSVAVMGDYNVVVNNANVEGGFVGALYGANVTYNGGSLKFTDGMSGRNCFYAASTNDKQSVITINNVDVNMANASGNTYLCAHGNAIIYVTGGNFYGKPVGSSNPYVKEATVGSYTGEVIITGGTFNFDPSDFVPTGYKATQNGSTWTVAAE